MRKVKRVVRDVDIDFGDLTDTIDTLYESRVNSWDSLKSGGSAHYKSRGSVEPIDLYKAGGMFRDFALCSIIKYAFRSRSTITEKEDFNKNMDKIIHYCKLLKAAFGEENA